LPGRNDERSMIVEEKIMAKNLFLLAGIALALTSLTGCHSCRQMTGGWFNRGDRCNVCPPPNCPPGGIPQGAMMLPGSPQVMPGPIEVAPTL
jgi:hypothetical protein